MFDRIVRVVEFTLAYIIFAALFSYSNPSLTDEIEKIRAYTRQLEFNYITWTWEAAVIKAQAASVAAPDAFDHETRQQLVAEYMRVTRLSMEYEHALQTIYADAKITDKQAASSDIRAKLEEVLARQEDIAPLAEAVLQGQVAEVLADLGLTTLGQPVPNVLYHSTPLPFALIVSPRDRIEQVANVSVNTDLTVDQQAALEERVDEGLNTSSLVVPIGGVGVYPTMVMRTTDLRWLLNTIAHEWTHNYLTLRPLGFLYTNSPELRTMNETTASIAGDEIGALVLERFYPQLMASTGQTRGLISLPMDSSQPDDPPFDFRAEMHETRITVDDMLAEGHIEEAEAYMEERRLIFLENGYLLRKINQAYFAFYGAYADVPGGAAGEDPVGPAVRALRTQSDSLADFINAISWMTSFEDLQEAVGSSN
jgi:hypothetical protein